MRPACLSSRLLVAALLVGAQAAQAGPACPPVEASAPLRATAGKIRTDTLVKDVARRWFMSQWLAYRATFVSPEGRVIDNANGGVSHSEGQGYGLLLAEQAGDEPGFALIWRWTADHLQVRSDGLFAWRWDPKLQAVTDQNNASDGDVLIAWALARAAKRFENTDYEVKARRIADVLAAEAVTPSKVGPILLPGIKGFAAVNQTDGPVINLSYWVFAAFRDLDALSPGHDWERLRRNGFSLIEASRFGPLALPTDWISVGGAKPTPARNFPAQFGYDAIRIPFYLASDPETPPDVLARFLSPAVGLKPTVIDAASGTALQALGGAGYRMIFALARCAAHGDNIPPDLMSERDSLYYPETLRLLSISVVQERYPQCL